MKKSIIFIMLVTAVGIFAFYNQTHASTGFELVSFNATTTAVENTPFSKTVRFIYSGSFAPSVSILEKNAPRDVRAKMLPCNPVGQCSFLFEGVVGQPGDYPLTIFLTDNNGAMLTQTFYLKVIRRELRITPLSLPDGTVGKNYFADIHVSYIGKINLNLRHNIRFDSGLDAVSIDHPASTEYPSGKYVVTIKGTPKAIANYKIELLIMGPSERAPGEFPYTFSINKAPQTQPVVSAPDISKLKIIVYADKSKKKTLNLLNNNKAAYPVFTYSGLNDIKGYYIYFGSKSNADPVKSGYYTVKNQFTPNKLTKNGTYYFIIKAKNKQGFISKAKTIKYIFKK